MGKRIKPLPGATVVDADVLEVEHDAPDGAEVPNENEQSAARAQAVAGGSLAIVPKGEAALYGGERFFRAAADQLALSTRQGLELAGAVVARQVGGRTLLLDLVRKSSGKPGRVAISPQWGGILWHTHPGLRGSLAAFSSEDLEAAKQAERPLLVVGFGGLSPDVLTTLTLPLGLRGALVSSGIKGLMSLEKSGRLQERLLRVGVAARVCYPDGTIQPVLRTRGSPFQHALDDVSYLIDRSVGVVERVGQRALKKVVKTAVERFK